jgi:hypothetical protein
LSHVNDEFIEEDEQRAFAERLRGYQRGREF